MKSQRGHARFGQCFPPPSLVNLCHQHQVWMESVSTSFQPQLSSPRSQFFSFLSKIMRVTDWMTRDSVPQMLLPKIRNAAREYTAIMMQIVRRSSSSRLVLLEMCHILEEWFLTAFELKTWNKLCKATKARIYVQTIASTHVRNKATQISH